MKDDRDNSIINGIFSNIWFYLISGVAVFVVNRYYSGSFDKNILVALVLVIIMMFALAFNADSIKANIELHRVGRIIGLWKEKGLKKKIKTLFNKATDVKIMVTRGSELLNIKQEYGFSKIFDEIKDNHRHVNVRFLLMVPCMKLQHVQDRYEAHKRETNPKIMTESDFLKTWYEFVQHAMSYNSEDFTVEIKFHYDSDSHPTWRFYIFENQNRISVLLNEYDQNGPGCRGPMYEIIQNPSNIAAKMYDQFNNIWKSAITLEQLKKIIQDGKCERFFCRRCQKSASNICKECVFGNCEHKGDCNKYVTNYLY